LGLGFDCKDGHIRVTKGNNFRLYGGSEETHKFMQEKAIKFNEQLDKKHKTLNDVDVNEFYDIAEKIGLKISDDFKKKKKKGE
jgi:hypothetical protein